MMGAMRGLRIAAGVAPGVAPGFASGVAPGVAVDWFVGVRVVTASAVAAA